MLVFRKIQIKHLKFHYTIPKSLFTKSGHAMVTNPVHNRLSRRWGKPLQSAYLRGLSS